jgi:heme-degrading monooxygenase HmoA
MLKHVVMLKFKAGISEADIQELEKGLGSLPAKLSQIKGYDFGRDLRSEKTFDFALVSTFENFDTLNAYKIHPNHQVVLKKVLELSETVQVVDFEY